MVIFLIISLSFLGGSSNSPSMDLKSTRILSRSRRTFSHKKSFSKSVHAAIILARHYTTTHLQICTTLLNKLEILNLNRILIFLSLQFRTQSNKPSLGWDVPEHLYCTVLQNEILDTTFSYVNGQELKNIIKQISWMYCSSYPLSVYQILNCCISSKYLDSTV